MGYSKCSDVPDKPSPIQRPNVVQERQAPMMKVFCLDSLGERASVKLS